MKPPRPRPKLWLSLLGALALAALFVRFLRGLPGAAEPGAPGTVLLSHVNLCDAAGQRLDRDLLWSEGRLRREGPGGSLQAEGARVLDGRGLWACPSLADAAVFLSLEGRYPADSRPAEPALSLQRQLGAGVGALLDLNAHRSFIQAARGLAGPRPRAAFAGALFTAPGGWRLGGQTPWESHLVELEEVEDLAEPWSRALRFGDQAVFASVEHEGRDRASLPPAVLKRLGELARGRGLPFIVQAHHAAKALQALEARPDALLGPLFGLEEAPGLARAMREARCLYLPALSVLANAFPPGSPESWPASFSAAAALDLTALAQAGEPARLEEWRRHWSRQGADPAQALAVPGQLAREGVSLAFATGSGSPLVFHGLGARSELEHLRRAGLAPAYAMAMAWTASRRLARLEGGSLAPGQPADLLLLSGNPLEDPSLAARPRLVVAAGQLFEP